MAALVFGGLAFIGIWIYAFISWGFLIGLAIGWLPALVGGIIVGLLWPLFLLAILALVAFIIYTIRQH